MASKSTIEEIKRKFTVPSRFKSTHLSIWNVTTQLSLKYPCVNLSQGFPDYSPPHFVRDELTQIGASPNHALLNPPRGYGQMRLVNVLAKLYSKKLNREINPESEVLVTCGAYEALYCSITGNVEVNDEVIVVEPFFDCFEPMVLVAGGVVRFIPLERTEKRDNEPETSASWKLDERKLRGLFNERTKMIIINSPLNPVGKVFSREELNLIAELCIRYDAICLADEVYEWHVFKPEEHVKVASLPGMWERTIAIGSAGKALCATGWKCGWALGPANLIQNAKVVHDINTSTYITPIQEAVARCLERELSRLDSPECLFNVVERELRTKRDYFVELLSDAGLKPVIPQGGFFILADWTGFEKKIVLSAEKEDQARDYQFMVWMLMNIQLLVIPPSAFYSKENRHIGEDFVRFCFFKHDDTIAATAECLRKLKNH